MSADRDVRPTAAELRELADETRRDRERKAKARARDLRFAFFEGKIARQTAVEAYDEWLQLIEGARQ